MALAILMVFSREAYAQQAQTLTLIPPASQFEIQPGGHVESSVKLVSDSTAPLDLTVSVVDFIVDNPNGVPHLMNDQSSQPDSTSYAASTWIQPDVRSFTLDPRSRAVVNYSIDIPRDALSGGHYAAIVFKPARLTSESVAGRPDKSQTSVKAQIAALVYITVPGAIHYDARILGFKVPSFLEFGPVPVSFQIQNLSNTHIRPIGKVEAVSLWRSKDSQTISKYNIFPSANRTYRNSVGSPWMIGPYSVQVRAQYAPGKEIIQGSTVWVIPWKLIAIFILALVVLGLALSHFREKRVQQRILREFDRFKSS